MSTVVPAALNRVYDLIAPHLSYERRGGIANPASPGYHTSREDLIRQGRSDNYSIQCPADRQGKAHYAAGIDITFGSLAELVVVHKRLRAACTPDAKGNYDPRMECVREFIGTLDGRKVSGYNRVPTGSGSRARVGWVDSGFGDSSHLWHEHISVLRDRVDNDNEMRGLAEVIAGVATGAFGYKPAGSVSVPEPTPPAEKPAGTVSYTIKAGDSLTKIAAALGVKAWQSLAALNPGIDPHNLRVGQVINVPTAAPVAPKTTTYKVKPGDTLSKIAAALGVEDWRTVAALNPGLDPHSIRVGQVLVVPVVAKVPEPTPKPPKEKPVRIRVTSTNMLDDTLASAKSHPWSGRKAGYIAAVKSTDPDVVLIQEATSRQVGDLVSALGSTWTWYRAEDTSRDDGPIAIAWNMAVLERTDVREIELPSNRRGLCVELRHEASGKKFDAVVSHLDNGSGAAVSTRDAQAKRLTEWLPGVVSKSEDSPLVFGADLNDKRTGSTGPRAELRKAGLVFIRDAVKVPGSEYESHHGFGTLSKGVGWIDDMAVRGMKIIEAAVVRTDKAAPIRAHRNVSDHVILRLVAEL